jgi:hypothetical protein
VVVVMAVMDGGGDVRQGQDPWVSDFLKFGVHPTLHCRVEVMNDEWTDAH